MAPSGLDLRFSVILYHFSIRILKWLLCLCGIRSTPPSVRHDWFGMALFFFFSFLSFRLGGWRRRFVSLAPPPRMDTDSDPCQENKCHLKSVNWSRGQSSSINKCSLFMFLRYMCHCSYLCWKGKTHQNHQLNKFFLVFKFLSIFCSNCFSCSSDFVRLTCYDLIVHVHSIWLS